jgi:hypothetical protein
VRLLELFGDGITRRNDDFRQKLMDLVLLGDWRWRWKKFGREAREGRVFEGPPSKRVIAVDQLASVDFGGADCR